MQLFGLLYYLSLFFESVKEKSPTVTGLVGLPISGTFIPASIIAGLIATRTGHFRWAVWLGWIISTLGFGLLVMLDTTTSVGTSSVFLLVTGLGLGLLLSSLNFTTQAIARTEDTAYAAAMYAFMRSFGITLGVAIGGTVFQNVMRRKLQSLGLPQEIAFDAEGYLATLGTLPADSVFKQGILKAYTSGCRGVFVALTAISGFGLVLSFFIKHFSLDQKLESKHVLRKKREKK